MRCKLHPYSNAVGVCAPCLRDRLLALAADAASCESSSCGSSPPRRHHTAGTGPFPLPRSVSPYAAHRRSDACAYAASSSAACHQQPSLLFFRTPQVGPAAAVRADDDPEEEGGGKKKKVARRPSFLSAIFGGRQEARTKEPPRRSTSWLSAIIRRKRRPAADLPQQQPDEEPESPGASSGSWWFPSPSPARQHRCRHGGGGDGISGFAVCLSPLVRPSSAGGRRRCQPPDPSSLSVGDSHRCHASVGGASFGRNTSRKLADMGRFR